MPRADNSKNHAFLRLCALRELVPFGMLALIAALLVMFGVIAGKVADGQTYAFDEVLLRALRNPADLADPIGPAWLSHLMRDITSLGSFTLVAMVTVVAGGYLLIDGKRATLLFVLTAVTGGIVLSEGLKHLFGRPRPELVAHLVEVQTASFPSGHAMLSAVTYLTLGAVLARTLSRNRLKAYVIAVSVVLTLLIGVSRVYLGVHWPTDVLAGWCAGAAWAMGCWLLADWLQSRGRIEQPDADADR